MVGRYEAHDGTIQTFAQTPKGTLKAHLGDRHDKAEHDHDARERGLSDHSAMYATFGLSSDRLAIA
jgi:hypothetical protein